LTRFVHGLRPLRHPTVRGDSDEGLDEGFDAGGAGDAGAAVVAPSKVMEPVVVRCGAVAWMVVMCPRISLRRRGAGVEVQLGDRPETFAAAEGDDQPVDRADGVEDGVISV